MWSWDEIESQEASYTRCPSCNGEGLEALNGGCWECDVAVDLERSPVRASFNVDAEGRVTEVRL